MAEQTNQVHPKVFISYSHDSKEHQDKVLQFSNKLRSQGIDCEIDQYEDSPPEGWPKWMDRMIKKSDFVLIICTEKYCEWADGEGEQGMGIKWESSLIYQQLYNSGANNTKYIPVLFEDGKFAHIPGPLQAATYYNVDDEESYEKLYRRLCGIKLEKPLLGKLRQLPEKERKTLFVANLIDQDKWEEAEWKGGIGYSFSEENPPILSFLFKNFDAGISLFEEMIAEIGAEDNDERLRISIVEGDVPNQYKGYYLVVDESAEAAESIVANLPDEKEVRYIAVNQRFHRVPLTSDNLQTFKEHFSKHGCYYIAAAEQIDDPVRGRGIRVQAEKMILKRRIQFRKYEDIPEYNDPDSILKSEQVKNHKF